MKILNKIQEIVSGISGIIRDEFRTISGSYAILLVLMGGIFVYGLLYNYMYAPDLVREVPVAVVDNSKSELSRKYIRLLDATPQVHILSTGMDYTEAQDLMKKGDVGGILYLPYDFEDRVAQGDESIFILYETTSAFLYYMAMQEASSASMLALNDEYRADMVVFLPVKDAAQLASAQPIQVVGTALFNPTEGYGSYLIPAVLIVIIFQTLLMVIGMISGRERHKHLLRRYEPTWKWAVSLVAGKTFVYTMLYAIFALFLLGLIPLLFDLPEIGNGMYIIMLLIPFLLSTCFFGLTASLFFTDSDAPLLMIAFFSVGLIFLSGVSYPMELMPWYWKAVHYVVPVAPAALAYVKLSSMGASMAEIHVQYLTLWIQCAVYFITACWVYKRNLNL